MKPAVETAQDSFELQWLLGLFNKLDPTDVLEVGTWHGGTLWHWLQGGRNVVSVDDSMFEADDWRSWAREGGSMLTLIHGDSAAPASVQTVGRLAPFDFIFIDAGHDARSVRADWANYGPMLRAGGAVAFHDIKPRAGYGVSDLWAELRQDANTVEISGTTPEFCGIGILWP